MRLGLGAGLAVALGQAGQIAGTVGALTAGAAAPLLFEQLSRQVPFPQEAQVSAQPDAPPAQDETVPPPRGARLSPSRTDFDEMLRELERLCDSLAAKEAIRAVEFRAELPWLRAIGDAAYRAESQHEWDQVVHAVLVRIAAIDRMLPGATTLAYDRRDDLREKWRLPAFRSVTDRAQVTRRPATMAQQVLAGFARSTPAFGGRTPVHR